MSPSGERRKGTPGRRGIPELCHGPVVLERSLASAHSLEAATDKASKMEVRVGRTGRPRVLALLDFSFNLSEPPPSQPGSRN